MTHNMQMSFDATVNVILWWKEWSVSEPGPYVGCLVTLLAMCLVHEALAAYRAHLLRSHLDPRKTIDVGPPGAPRCAHALHPLAVLRAYTVPFTRIVRLPMLYGVA